MTAPPTTCTPSSMRTGCRATALCTPRRLTGRSRISPSPRPAARDRAAGRGEGEILDRPVSRRGVQRAVARHPVTRRLPPQTALTIGDRLSAAGVDWAWYSGGWSNADGEVGAPGWTNGSGPGPACSDPNAVSTAVWPNCPDKLFQFHHQPFNYFASFAPLTAARARHLRDEAEFLGLARSSTTTCQLKPVSFVKPIGAENEHPGYTSESAGSNHLVELLRALQDSRCARDTMIVVTYDEFGGQWDHVSPPGQGGTPGPHDAHGPGTRIPAFVIAPHLHGNFVVDHV